MSAVRWTFALLVALLVAAPVSQGRAAPLRAVDWNNLPYLDTAFQHMLVTTDGSWSHAKVVDAGSLNPGYFAPATGYFSGLKLRYIWAPKCNLGRQFVSFSKTVMAYGAAYSGTFDMAYGPALKRPYEKATLLINGTEIAHLGNTAASTPAAIGAAGAIPVSALKAFQYGPNTLTIRVQKTALPRGERCTIPNRIGSYPRYIGVLAYIDLRFGAILTALPSTAGSRVVQGKLGPGSAVSVIGAVNFRNDGPSASLSGKVTVSVTGDTNLTALFNTLVISGPPPAPFVSCTIDPQFHQQMTCPYREFRAGTIAKLPAAFAFKLDNSFPTNGVRKGRITWIISSDASNDPTGGKLGTHVNVVLCGTVALDPVCAG
jgi:hypothetical protein